MWLFSGFSTPFGKHEILWDTMTIQVEICGQLMVLYVQVPWQSFFLTSLKHSIFYSLDAVDAEGFMCCYHTRMLDLISGTVSHFWHQCREHDLLANVSRLTAVQNPVLDWVYVLRFFPINVAPTYIYCRCRSPVSPCRTQAEFLGTYPTSATNVAYILLTCIPLMQGAVQPAVLGWDEISTLYLA